MRSICGALNRLFISRMGSPSTWFWMMVEILPTSFMLNTHSSWKVTCSFCQALFCLGGHLSIFSVGIPCLCKRGGGMMQMHVPAGYGCVHENCVQSKNRISYLQELLFPSLLCSTYTTLMYPSGHHSLYPLPEWPVLLLTGQKLPGNGLCFRIA